MKHSVYVKSLAQFETVPNVQLQIEILYGERKKNQPQKVFFHVYHEQTETWESNYCLQLPNPQQQKNRYLLWVLKCNIALHSAY